MKVSRFLVTQPAISAVLQMHVPKFDVVSEGYEIRVVCTCLWESTHEKLPNHNGFDHPTRVKLRKEACDHMAEMIFREGRVKK